MKRQENSNVFNIRISTSKRNTQLKTEDDNCRHTHLSGYYCVLKGILTEVVGSCNDGGF